MIVVSLFNANLQYLSFRSFIQLHQIVPYSTIYYVNILFSYVVLFFVLIYGISAVVVFNSIYNRLSKDYIL